MEGERKEGTKEEEMDMEGEKEGERMRGRGEEVVEEMKIERLNFEEKGRPSSISFLNHHG